MPGKLTVRERHDVALAVWPELRHLSIGYQLGHALVVEAVLDGDDTAPVSASERKRINELAAEIGGQAA